MDQELNTILQNIEALVQQAKMATGAGASEAGAEDDVTPEMLDKIMRAMGDKKEDEVKKNDDKDEDDKDKAVEKSDEGPNASDKADERMDSTDPETEKNINEVAKQVAKMLLAKKSVHKSDEKQELYRVIKSLAEEVMEQRKALTGMIEGFGIAEQITSMTPEKRVVEKSLPKNDLTEIKKSIAEIEKISGQKKADDKGVGDTSHYLAKSLTETPDLLRGIFFRNSR